MLGKDCIFRRGEKDNWEEGYFAGFGLTYEEVENGAGQYTTVLVVDGKGYIVELYKGDRWDNFRFVCELDKLGQPAQRHNS